MATGWPWGVSLLYHVAGLVMTSVWAEFFRDSQLLLAAVVTSLLVLSAQTALLELARLVVFRQPAHRQWAGFRELMVALSR